MFKLLIVDDEELTREGLRQTVDWASRNVTVVGVAENGQKGLEAAHALQPDLIVADVRMPVMDGLEMAGVLYRENADLAVVVLSGYADFENARRALDFGVSSFLLKPVDNEELLDKCSLALEKLQKKRKAAKMDSSLPIIQKHRLVQFFAGRATEQDLREFGINLPQTGTLVCAQTKNNNFAPFLAECQAQADCCLAQQLDERLVAIFSSPKSQTAATIGKILDKLLSETSTRYNVSACEYQSGLASQAFETAQKLCRNARFFAINSVVTEDFGNFKKIVRDALAIIERDYAKKISVKSVAFELYTSESTLMHEFKSQTGKTFNECLTEYRMAKARELLLEGNMRIGEIGYAVGYTDVKYFGQVFKETFGCTPSEFLENI